jgi:Rod binding domain-containing protein
MQAVAVSPDILKAAPASPEGKTREQIAHAAKQFEASFLSIMLGQMFKDVGGGEFSGGQGETMFQSFLMDAFSQQMTRSGGVGLAASVQREMLKLQGME